MRTGGLHSIAMFHGGLFAKFESESARQNTGWLYLLRAEKHSKRYSKHVARTDFLSSKRETK